MLFTASGHYITILQVCQYVLGWRSLVIYKGNLPGWRNGRRTSLRSWREQSHGGSSPLPGTMPKIIFQNQDFIVVDKPVGLAVHAGVGTSEKTFVDFLLEKFPEIKSVGDAPEVRPGIVHRLDKETSGVMVVARNQKAFEYLKDLFKNRQIEKKYLAVVYGKMKEKTGKIEGEMGRSKKDFRKQALVRGKISVRKERYSLTHYKVKKESEKYPLLEVTPKTGRMHQIRVHLHSIGHPIVGDKKYTFKEYRKISTPRMFLHAASISFIDPNNEKYFFESEVPEEFEKFLDHKNTP
jgi:23S rRNA pseudouridine1911/1915/1917 synthase